MSLVQSVSRYKQLHIASFKLEFSEEKRISELAVKSIAYFGRLVIPQVMS